MERRVSFYSEGFKLAGTLYIPDDLMEGQKRSSIIMLRGYAANARDRHPTLPFYRYFCKKGYIVLSLDYRGFGDSEGPRWRMIPMVEVEDVRNAITFLQQQPEIDGSNIGVWGTSYGGTIALYVAAVDERAICAAANVPSSNGLKRLQSYRNKEEWQAFLKELEEDRIRRVLTGASKMVSWQNILIFDSKSRARMDQLLKEDPDAYATELPIETGQAVLEFKLDEVIHKIAPRPILITTAERDMLNSPATIREELYDKAGEPKTFMIIEGVDHYGIYSPPHWQLVMDKTFAWFNKYMPPYLSPFSEKG